MTFRYSSVQTIPSSSGSLYLLPPSESGEELRGLDDGECRWMGDRARYTNQILMLAVFGQLHGWMLNTKISKMRRVRRSDLFLTILRFRVRVSSKLFAVMRRSPILLPWFLARKAEPNFSSLNWLLLKGILIFCSLLKPTEKQDQNPVAWFSFLGGHFWFKKSFFTSNLGTEIKTLKRIKNWKGHFTLTHQAVATTPSDFTRMLPKWFLLMKNEGLPSRFAIKWSLAPPRTKSNLRQKIDNFRLFLRFSIISPKFFNRFCYFRLHCVQDIPTNNSFFHKNSNIFCLNDITTQNVQNC